LKEKLPSNPFLIISSFLEKTMQNGAHNILVHGDGDGGVGRKKEKIISGDGSKLQIQWKRGRLR